MADGQRFYRAFKLATFVVVASGFGGLLLTEEAGRGLWLVVLFSLIFSWPEQRPLKNADSMWKVLTLGFITYLAFAWLVLHTSSVTMGLQLLVFLQMNRLFTRRSNRDHVYLYLIAFLQLLLGCVLTVQPLFALVLMSFLVSTTWALLLFQLKRGMDESAEPGSGVGGPSLWVRLKRFVVGPVEEPPPEPDAALTYAPAGKLLAPRFVVVISVITLAMLLSTLGIFLITPRLDLALLRGAGGDSVHMAGFSDRVRLGEVGEIKQGGAKVMRAQLGGSWIDMGRTPPLYWRGTTLDVFDGRTWSLSDDEKQAYYSGRGGLLNPPVPPRDWNLLQEITLEPLDTPVLFALPRVVAFESRVTTLYRSNTGGFSIDPGQGRVSYKVWSEVKEPDPEVLRQSGERYPRGVLSQYLQVPDRVSPELYELVTLVTGSATTPYDKVANLQKYLSENYEYTLEPRSSGPSPLEDFLLRTKAGHCEYFASAFVVMARLAGVPARIVNGFFGGTYNDVGRYYLITQDEAHSWAEVFFPQVGWIRFDPTPPAGIPVSGVEKSQIAMYMDYMESIWYFYVLYYNLDTQVDFMLDLWKKWGAKVPQQRGNRRSQHTETDTSLPDLAWLWGPLALGGITWFVLRMWRSRAAAKDAPPLLGDPAAVRQYLKARAALDETLTQKGLARRPSETPRERAHRAQATLGPHAKGLIDMEERWYLHRYGGGVVTPADVTRVEEVRRGVREGVDGR